MFFLILHYIYRQIALDKLLWYTARYSQVTIGFYWNIKFVVTNITWLKKLSSYETNSRYCLKYLLSEISWTSICHFFFFLILFLTVILTVANSYGKLLFFSSRVGFHFFNLAHSRLGLWYYQQLLKVSLKVHLIPFLNREVFVNQSAMGQMLYWRKIKLVSETMRSP